MKSQAHLSGDEDPERPRPVISAAPIAALIFISPVLAELLMGVVRLSNLWLLLPEMAVYGSAALIIREIVRRTGRGWGSMLLLGMAYAVAEECIILQTSLTRQFFPPDAFGWVGSANWIYLVALVWYEAAYAIVLPIYLVEMLFPAQREHPWLTNRGLWITGAVFVLSAAGVYELWHRLGLQRYGGDVSPVPLSYLGGALAAMAVLVAAALLLPRSAAEPAREKARRAPAPWLVGVLAFGFGLAWFLLIIMAYVPASSVQGASPFVPIAVGVTWLVIGLVVFGAISSGAGWSDRHRLALIFGMSLASMLGGLVVVVTASPLDILSKLVFDALGIACFAWMSARLRQRGRAASSAAEPQQA